MIFTGELIEYNNELYATYSRGSGTRYLTKYNGQNTEQIITGNYAGDPIVYKGALYFRQLDASNTPSNSLYSFDGINLNEIESEDNYLGYPFEYDSDLYLLYSNANGIHLAKFSEEAPLSYQDEKILLYPNPTSSYFEIQGSMIDKVRIYDVTGKMVLLEENTNRVDVKGLEKGIYYVQFSNTAGEKFKLIID